MDAMQVIKQGVDSLRAQLERRRTAIPTEIETLKAELDEVTKMLRQLDAAEAKPAAGAAKRGRKPSRPDVDPSQIIVAALRQAPEGLNEAGLTALVGQDDLAEVLAALEETRRIRRIGRRYFAGAMALAEESSAG